MRPLRFCMLTTFYPPWSFGGDAIQVARLARALANRGHEVTVVHSREGYRALAPAPAEATEPDPGIEVLAVDAGIGPVSPLLTYVSGRPLATKRALGRILARGFDVLHFHNPSLLGGPAVLAMGEGIKIYTAHEQWLVCPTHVLWQYRRRVCERPRCWLCTATYRRPPQPWRSTGLLERSLAHLDALIVPSRTSALLHRRFADTVPIERIPHFVPEPAEPTAAVRERLAERPYFLFVGRHDAIKGLGPLIEAFRRRRSEDLLIAGDGPLTARLRRAAADLPHVRFLGWQDGARLDALYRGALAVVVPTVGHESFGLVAVEAFARGTPAIVHGFGALGELMEESGGGIAYRTPNELDAALARLADDEALRARLGERGRAAYEERWSEDVHMRGYLGLVERLAGERAGAVSAMTVRSRSGA